MIFDITDVEDASPVPQGKPVAAQQLLFACAREAERLATDLSNFDQALAGLLDSHQLPGNLLQHIDLARQEAEGLAGVLSVIANVPALDHMVDAATLTEILRVRAQHARISVKNFHDSSRVSNDT